MSALDYKKCVSCGGALTVNDICTGEPRPCSVCQKDAYAAWIKNLQPKTRRVARIDASGRCCGRKPLVYKKPVHRLFCDRCCAEIDPSTGTQVENWAWVQDGEWFVATHPTYEYARGEAA